MLNVNDLTVRIDDRALVSHVSFSVQAGEWLMLLGPNGAGKSTLIEAIAGGIPYTGHLTLMGQDIRRLKPAQLAQKLGVLAQKNAVGYAYSVEEIVSLGRYAHGSFFSGTDVGNQEAITQALALTGLSHLRHANVMTLSGGELQRTFLAQVLAQDPQLLILDEPANHLDLDFTRQLFALLEDWVRTPGRALISVVHDLSLAKKYGTHALLLDEGNTAAQGKIGDVLTSENLQRVYHMDVTGWMREMLTQWK